MMMMMMMMMMIKSPSVAQRLPHPAHGAAAEPQGMLSGIFALVGCLMF
jgi:hypothetical protein